MTTRTFDWPTREQWAEQVRTFYADMGDDARASVGSRTGDYATPDEVAQAVRELRALWTDLGRQLRATTRALAHVTVPDGRTEGWEAHFAALRALPAEDQENRDRHRTLQYQRQHINAVIKELTRPSDGLLNQYEISNANALSCPTFATIVERWQDTQQAAVDELRGRVESRPIDDVAWQRELQRRAEIERYFRDGPIIGHQRRSGDS